MRAIQIKKGPAEIASAGPFPRSWGARLDHRGLGVQTLKYAAIDFQIYAGVVVPFVPLSASGPAGHRKVHDSQQLLAGTAMLGLQSDALENHGEVARHILGCYRFWHLTGFLGLVEALLELARYGAATDLVLPLRGKGGRSVVQRRLGDEAAACILGVSEILHRIAKQLMDSLAGGQASKALGDVLSGVTAVALKGEAIELFLVPEGGIHAGAAYAHGLGEVREGGRLEALVSEYFHGRIKGLVRAEGARTARGISSDSLFHMPLAPCRLVVYDLYHSVQNISSARRSSEAN